jgi:hypothetical protein
LTYPKTVLLLFFAVSLITINLPLNLNLLYVVHPLNYLCVIILIIITQKDTEFKNLFPRFKKIIITYWLYSIFITVLGLVLSENYWDYKNVLFHYIPVVFISLTIFLGIRFEENLDILKFLMNIIFPITTIIGILLYIIFNEFLYKNDYDFLITRLTIPIFFFVLAVPFLTRKNKILILIFSIFYIFIDPLWRTNIIRIGACWIFVIIYLTFGLNKKLLNIFGIVTLIIPLIFLYTGYTGKLDIFEYYTIDNSELNLTQRKQFSNTRTFLYVEVIDSMKNKDNSLLFGGGASNGYQTNYFFDTNVSISTNQERYKTEVAFLNTLNRSGLIGALLEILILFFAAYYAINKSNNNFCKLLALYLYLSYVLYFIELPQAVNLGYFFYYFIIGICLNNSFRQSDDKKIKFLFKTI